MGHPCELHSARGRVFARGSERFSLIIVTDMLRPTSRGMHLDLWKLFVEFCEQPSVVSKVRCLWQQEAVLRPVK